MHELLAPLLYAVDFDCLSSLPSSPASSTSESTDSRTPDQTLHELCSPSYIAADAHALFTTVMSKIGSWYEWREPPPASPAAPAVNATMSTSTGRMELPRPYVAPIVGTCHEVYDTFLKPCDPALWAALGRAEIEPQIYGM